MMTARRSRMIQQLRPFGGDWWRFDRYEIRDGFILPASGATLVRYVPWGDYWTARNAPTRAEQQSPYMALIELARTVRTVPSGPTSRGEWFQNLIPADESSRVALLEWCAKYGLLGL